MKRTFLLSLLVNLSTCRDFYLGKFNKNDLLMSQDTVYKERVPFRVTYAKYGRVFKCPITYVRVLDRLNVGRGPRVQIIRGGLRKNYIVLRLTSPYNNPISANIFVGCENKKYTNPPWKIIRPTTKAPVKDKGITDDTANVASSDSISETTLKGAGEETTVEGDTANPEAAGEETTVDSETINPDNAGEETTVDGENENLDNAGKETTVEGEATTETSFDK